MVTAATNKYQHLIEKCTKVEQLKKNSLREMSRILVYGFL